MDKPYSNLTVALHWLLVPIILMALYMGSDIASLDDDLDLKVDRLIVHMAAGILIGFLFLVRVLIKIFTVNTPDQKKTKIEILAVLAHRTLYAVVFLVVISGIAIMIEVDMQAIVASGEIMPMGFSELPIRQLHDALTSLLMLLITAHALAALYHQFILKDKLFSKMWFKKFK